MAIRFARAEDCAAMRAIYAQYIDTTITFEQSLPSQAEFLGRMQAVQVAYPWLVWEEDGTVLGYAYAHAFGERISYQPSAELSVYIDSAARGRGLGKRLYGALMGLLALQNVKTVYGIVTSPNERSEALHRAMGFSCQARLTNVGYKNGWRDVCWYAKAIGAYEAAYEGLLPIGEVSPRAVEEILTQETRGTESMEIRLIAFDLDGTLLRPDKTIAPRTMQALLRAREKGVRLVPATGRLYATLPEELKDGALFENLILVNGAEVYDSRRKTAIARAELSAAQAQALCGELQKLPVLTGIYQSGQGWMAREDYARLPQVMRDEAVLALVYRAFRPTDDLFAQICAGGSVQKVIAYFKTQEEKQRYLEILRAQYPQYAVSSAFANNIEINAANATKGDALKTLCERLGLSSAQCMAFGDDLNDCTMLRAAGLGVAMGNASEAVKACADEVTQSNAEDGVAQMIERVLGL